MVDCINKICSVCNNDCQMCDVEYQCIECEHLENNKDSILPSISNFVINLKKSIV